MNIHQIDFHCHAGSDLRELLSFARDTRRAVVGVTETFYGENGPENALSVDDFLCLRAELDECKREFSDLALFFAPELAPGVRADELDGQLAAASDYFLCLPAEGNGDDQTAFLISQLERAAEVSCRTGKPAVLAYAFQTLLAGRVQSGRRAPARYAGRDSLTDEQVQAALGLDLEAVADAAVRLEVPLEICGETYVGIRSYNHPYYLDVWVKAFEILRRGGVSFVPGSGLKAFRLGKRGSAVPHEVFARLGIAAGDIGLLRALGVTLS